MIARILVILVWRPIVIAGIGERVGSLVIDIGLWLVDKVGLKLGLRLRN